MPKTKGRILRLKDDGDIEIRAPGGIPPEVGTRFNVLNSEGIAVAEIKVVRVGSSKIIARKFLSSTAKGADTGAQIGTLIHPSAGAVIGGVIGAMAGWVFQEDLHPGMEIAPIQRAAAD